MVEFGYALSSEEHRPNDLVRYAQRAEEIGFTFAMISDHFHPWIDRQGQSPFVWTVIGGIAQATSELRIGTGVSCPTMRNHPAIIAQAAATTTAMMPGRFFLGVGTGENLNEHIIGQHWPETTVRQEMLTEAIEIIRELWHGEWVSYYGAFFTVENARLYTLPDTLPPIYVAASGAESAGLAGELGDGLISTAGNQSIVEQFEQSGGAGKPRFGQLTVCWAESEDEAVQTALDWWPTTAIPGALSSELPLPQHFEQAAQLVRPDDIKKQIVCGPDRNRFLEQISEFAKVGYDHIYIHQVGPDQEGFFLFCQSELLPAAKSIEVK